MTLDLEDEYGLDLGFDYEKTATEVIDQVLEEEGCPYEAQVNLLLTSDPEIHRMNMEYREVDRPTDVLSFPQVEYESPADFSWAEEHEMDCFDPDTGELFLGDIVISLDKVKEQAEKYNHSVRREFAFLVAHSMLHLLGYDHMTPEEQRIWNPDSRLFWSTLELQGINTKIRGKIWVTAIKNPIISCREVFWPLHLFWCVLSEWSIGSLLQESWVP